MVSTFLPRVCFGILLISMKGFSISQDIRGPGWHMVLRGLVGPRISGDRNKKPKSIAHGEFRNIPWHGYARFQGEPRETRVRDCSLVGSSVTYSAETPDYIHLVPNRPFSCAFRLAWTVWDRRFTYRNEYMYKRILDYLGTNEIPVFDFEACCTGFWGSLPRDPRKPAESG